MNQDFISALQSKGLQVETEHELAKYTTWKIGGPAEYFLATNTTAELTQAIEIALEFNINYTILGGGSNVLISDQGIKGLVIKNKAAEVVIHEENSDITVNELTTEKIPARLEQVNPEEYYSFADLDYDESNYPNILVTVDAGVTLSYLINVLISKGVTGLQWFAGIPGTVGGALYNNIHGGSHFFSEYVSSVLILDEEGKQKKLELKELDFDYDYSRFHNTSEVILKADLKLKLGDKEQARNTAIAWATKKKLQPHNSAGCCFQNLTIEQQQKANLDSNSWGYIIDQILGLKGKTIGKAKISPHHAAFIETEAGASSDDVLALFELIYTKAQEKIGLTPKLEVFLLGFPQETIEKFT